MATDDDLPPRIAETEGELRGVLADTSLAPLLPHLQLGAYFPRSPARVYGQESQTRAAVIAIEIVAGVLLASAALSVWRLSPFPLVWALLLAIPVIVLARRQMDSIYGATSEVQRFIELLAWDRRAPVVYLRRFEGEDPPLPALRKLSSVARAGNPGGVEAFENLAQMLDAAGPVVGLGRPGEKEIAHRIWRLYTPDAHWKDVVGHLIGRAKAVFMCHGKGPIIDWELSQALAASLPAVFVLVRGLPRETVRDEKAARSAVPHRIKALQRPTTYVDAINDRYRADEHGLLVVVTPEAVRVHAVKIHFQQLWDVLMREVVHGVRIAETRTFAGMPPVYQPLVQAVAGGSPWYDVGAVAGGAAAVVAWMAMGAL
jgi:hypothetical protein